MYRTVTVCSVTKPQLHAVCMLVMDGRDKLFPAPSGFEAECMHPTELGKVTKKKISAPAMHDTLFMQDAL
jgi:hypothetical protein